MSGIAHPLNLEDYRPEPVRAAGDAGHIVGVQLAHVGVVLHLNSDVLVASAVRLQGGPIRGARLVVPCELTNPERSTGILQASMPCAVLATIIAIEYDLLPGLATTTDLFSTLASLITLTVVLSLV